MCLCWWDVRNISHNILIHLGRSVVHTCSRFCMDFEAWILGRTFPSLPSGAVFTTSSTFGTLPFPGFELLLELFMFRRLVRLLNFRMLPFFICFHLDFAEPNLIFAEVVVIESLDEPEPELVNEDLKIKSGIAIQSGYKYFTHKIKIHRNTRFLIV